MTAVLFRHGARALTESCLKCFVGTEVQQSTCEMLASKLQCLQSLSSRQNIAAAWDKSSIGMLSEVGKNQSEALGEHLANCFFQGERELSSVSWLSSRSKRALGSGKHCIDR